MLQAKPPVEVPGVSVSRLGVFPQRAVDDCHARCLVAALACGDTATARTILSTPPLPSLDRRVTMPWGGARLLPLEALLGSPAAECGRCALVRQLSACGASMNVRWTDTSGEHTPLSKALALRHLQLASALVACGASPSTALLETSLLECCRFHPPLVRWLLDAGADVTVPALHSPRGCQPSAGSASAVATVLGKCGLELHVLTHLASLHAAPGGGSAPAHRAALLRRVAEILVMLLAAGAPPFRLPPAVAAAALSANGSRSPGLRPDLLSDLAASAALLASAGVPPPLPAAALAAPLPLQQEEGEAQQQHEAEGPEGLPRIDLLQQGPATPPGSPPGPLSPPPLGLSADSWQFLLPFATQVPRWSPQLHSLFPRPVRLAVRELLLISRCRGFSSKDSGSDVARRELALPQLQLQPAGAEVLQSSEQHQQRQPEGPVWLDMNVVFHIAEAVARVWYART